ncbi:hypothetical protein A0H81_04935 [Grifola frondosa]|uniref:Kinase n=1 Tax=Grifola frondosa TaxID=5627 RepID=A0A1C7MGK4_GRIFR|nr:hypothetical protein A0H81_04935 [Grifola frondosa]
MIDDAITCLPSSATAFSTAALSPCSKSCQLSPVPLPLPSTPKHIPLESQVGGHPGVLTSEDGSLLIKPALPVEVAFYQSGGKVDTKVTTIEPGVINVLEEVAEVEKDECIFVDTLPNILDIKLGTVLYDQDATPEKRAHMEKQARETTSLETGIRLTGFQVYNLATGKPVNTPKSYGKSIKAVDLPEGIARFFPTATSAPSTPPTPPSNASTPPTNLLSTSSSSSSSDSLADETFPEMQKEIRDALAELHMRMVGGSLLIVYEADWQHARAGLHMLEECGEDEDMEDEEEETDEDDDETQAKHVGPHTL